MSGKIHQIVFEQAGFPRSLVDEADFRAAIARRALGPMTIVIVYRDSNARPISQLAGDVPELRPLFQLLAASAAEGEQDTAAPEDVAQPPPAGLEPEDESSSIFWLDGDHRSEDSAEDRPSDDPPRARRAVLVGIGCGALLLAALMAWAILVRSPSRPRAEEQPRTYRVISPANLRRAAGLKGEWVRTLRRNVIVMATLDKKTNGAWLRVAEGEYEGLFIWSENLELVNAGQEQIGNMN